MTKISFSKALTAEKEKEAMEIYGDLKDKKINKNEFLKRINKLLSTSYKAYETPFRYLSQLDKRSDDMLKNDVDYMIKKKQLSLEKIEMNKKIKELAIQTNYREAIKDYFKDVKPIKVKQLKNNNKKDLKEINVFMSDFHYKTGNTMHIEDSFTSLLKELSGVGKINKLFLMGDFVENALRIDDVYEGDFDVIKQTLGLSDIFINNIKTLLTKVQIDEILVFEGNHDQIRQTKYKGKKNSNVASIISSYLDTVFEDIKVTQHHSLEIDGTLYVHGDHTMFNNVKAMENFSINKNKFVVHGHYHNFSYNEYRLGLPAIVGENDFSTKIGKFAKRGYVIEEDGFYKPVYF